ncbi:hypothetical protein DRP04_00965 [Archaeoglobales archaeon]|nr:MAG: hypothetical protein DRP04_00965 [Archaeoglobales archaeon]
MNFGQAVQEVLRWVDWNGSNAETLAKSWLNRTREDIATKFNFEFLFTIATATTTSSNTYNFPDDLLDHLMIFIDDEDGNPILIYEMTPGYWANLVKVPSPLDLSADTPPYRVLLQGNYFRIIPDPPSGRTLTLWYYRCPETLTNDTDTDYFLTTYGETVVWGAAWRGAVYLDDEQKIPKFRAAYEDGIKTMIARENRKKADRKGVVRFKTWRDFPPATMRRIFGVF